MKKILFIIIIAIASLNAKPCMTDIYYGNGVWNTRSQGEDGMWALRRFMQTKAITPLSIEDEKNKLYTFKHAYNPSIGTQADLIETFWQLRESGQISDGYFTFITGTLAGTDPTSDYFTKLQEIISQYNGDVDTMFTIYQNSSFNQRHNVLLVAHSQGNLFGNKMYTLMNDTQKSKFRMVSVATPANNVAGGGPYVTAAGDYVINPIPGALPSNVDGVGHTFIGTYLNGSINAPRKIALYVKSAYDNLLQFSTCGGYKYIKVLMPTFGNIIFVARPYGAYRDEIVGKTSLPVYKKDNCFDPLTSYTTYTTGNGWNDTWAYYNLSDVFDGIYTASRMEWLPGRLHSQEELYAASQLPPEKVLMGDGCVWLGLKEQKGLYSIISEVFSEE